ncbi:putative PTR2-Di-and tripeptide permease [Jaminaea rosea]|uniref:Putative PTR2-Di-and tripeptide permease n=1 Tax=Jaminaea rosea TaxID=1569628 RepID=A0A316UMH6_9BASI|nr:putative PTR2-Di-and tripeptide permease [Jaminaea rosea]PWN26018.1 putative PTR2-Di-and tripeptide permease [Jaminaea rosea]
MAATGAQDHMDLALAEANADEHRAETRIAGHEDKVHPLAHIEHGVDNEKAEVTEDEYGNQFPTEEEKNTLRRLPESIPWTAWTVAFCELAERFSYYGSVQVFQNFIQYPRPGEGANVHRTGAAKDLRVSGALGKGQQTATGLTTFNSFFVYLTPLVGAYIADAHLGRFKTICLAVGIATVGHVLLTGAAAPDILDHPNGALGMFVVSIIIMGVGTGFFKSNCSTLIAEQVKGKRPTVQTLKSGERVIIDPALTIARLFMYFYAAINIGAIVGQVAMVYAEKRVGFWLSFLLPTVVFLLCVPVLAVCGKWYQKTPPAGSVLSDALKFLKFASKGRWSLNPVRTYKQLTAGNFWEQAKPSKQTGPLPAWMTFDDVWVDELRRAVKACQVFLFFPVYWLCYNQINNNLTSQAAVMELHGLPNDLISNLDPLAILIFIPVLDLGVYPLLRKWGFNFTPLKRICAGFFLASFAMVSAAVVQAYIYKLSPCGTNAAECETPEGDVQPAPINVAAQVPSYVLIAFSELFASVTGLEYAFTKAPKSMKSMVMALFLFMTAISNAVGEAFLPLSEDPLLVWNYGVFAVASFIAAIVFWICFRKLDAEEDELNAIGVGNRNAAPRTGGATDAAPGSESASMRERDDKA